MKALLTLVMVLLITSGMLAQDVSLAQKTYIQVIKDGMSTAPEFVVIKVKNLNTGQEKEICTDVTSLFWSLQQENIEEFNKDYKTYLLIRSSYRTFSFKNKKALERLNFDNYKVIGDKTIRFTIENNHLRDSLKRLTAFMLYKSKEFDKIYESKSDILDSISDSITKIRPLTEEEGKMIKDLNDQYYYDQYNNPTYKKNHQMSQQCEKLLNIWNSKTENYKKRTLKMEKESARMEYKFFRNYYNKYGLDFCQVAFKYGIITYIADESGIVSYGGIIN